MALSLALSACAQFGGRTDDAGTQVSVATPTAWTSTDPSIVTAAPSPESLAGWWRQFGDAQLDALIAELARGGRLDPLSAAASLDRIVKAEKRPAPLKRLIEWSQKWLYDLALACEGQPLRYFGSQGATIQRLKDNAGTASVLAFNKKTLQYRMHCEQPLNSRLFLEEFFMSYAAIFRTT